MLAAAGIALGFRLVPGPALVRAERTWTITTSADAGPGSLRESLEQQAPGDTIRFDPAVFPFDAPGVIALLSDLPEIRSSGLVLDAGGAGVVLSGTRLRGTNSSNTGIIVRDAADVAIRGLIFDDFGGGAIDLKGGAARTTIGAHPDSPEVEAQDGNVFCGGTVGVRIGRAGAVGNVVAGNRFGSMRNGANRPCGGQAASSVFVFAGAQGTRIGGPGDGAGNVLVACEQVAISVVGPRVSDTEIAGNRIGIDDQDLTVPNFAGIEVSGGATDTIIGGSAGNVVSGNRNVGIAVTGAGTTGTRVLGNVVAGNRGGGIILGQDEHTVVRGNLVGLSAAGRAMGNGAIGIGSFGSVGARIGTATQGEGNRIVSSDQYGVVVGLGRDNHVVGNEIGLPSSPSDAFGNKQGGVLAGISDATTSITDNVIQGNRGYAATIAAAVHFTANRVADNEHDAALVVGGSLPPGATTWSRQGDLFTYVIMDGPPLQVPPASSLRVLPGVHLLFDHGLSFDIAGRLEVSGTAVDPVVFAPAPLTTHPLPGDWQGLHFAPGSTGALTNTHIELAATGIDVDGATVSMDGGGVTGSLGDGFHVRAGNVSLSGDVQLAGNGQDGSSAALRNDTPAPIDARGAWWGAADGPRTVDRPAAGGDRVVGPARVDGWLASPPLAAGGADAPWAVAPVLNPGAHPALASIADGRDFRWFRLPVGRRGSTVNASLTGLAADFDLFLFHGLTSGPSSPEGVGPSSPEGIGPSSPEGIGSGELDGDDAQAGCSAGYLAELVRLGMASNAGQLVASSCRFGDADEGLEREVWDQSGWYYLLAAPHNGAQAPDRPFDLQLDVLPGPPASDVAGAAQLTVTPVEPDVRTLIVWPQQRFEGRFGRERTTALRQAIERLAADPGVHGFVVAIDEVAGAQAAFAQWDASPGDPVQANRLANVIRAHLLSIAPAQLADIVLVGSDDLVPFHRVPDETLLSNERTYAPEVAQDSPLGAALREGYFLSDVPYAASDGLPYRGRTIPAQRYNVGRLVETPEEIAAAIDAFLRQPTIEATSALVTGYDFLDDMAGAVADRLERTGLGIGGVERLINDSWTPGDLLAQWTRRSFDLIGLNAHFTHRQAIAASASDVGGRGFIEPAELARDGRLDDALVFSVGCHSGLSVPDHGPPGATTDFAQIALGSGAAWLGNTGYGYGDADAIAYSERLMTLFVDHLGNGLSTGAALRAARADYLAGVGHRGLTPYDEKVLGVATLYGLPMQVVRLPAVPPGEGPAVVRRAEPGHESFEQAAADPTKARQSAKRRALTGHAATALAPIGPLEACRHGQAALCRTARFDFTYDDPVRAAPPIAGRYFTLAGESGSLPGQPIFARSSVTVTVPGMLARGAFLEGGRYRTLSGFDPVITRVVTDTSALPMWRTEPVYTRPGWTRTHWALVNAVGWRQDLRQRLVVTPEQYRPESDRTGVLRQMEAITYTLYYSNHADSLPPSVWSVRAHAGAERAALQVEAADFSGVLRVAVAFTDGSGVWQSRDLTQAHDAQGRPTDHWDGELPLARGLEYFVQAVDAVGNVVVNDNKGRYFTIATPQLAFPIGLSAAALR
ncbi:MAG: hypothetical protein IT332_13110 [Ardenticatenales bacterium]|nr:hypothetical protein [Ardenticatenales bacterium]